MPMPCTVVLLVMAPSADSANLPPPTWAHLEKVASVPSKSVR